MPLRDKWPTVVAIINAIGNDISKTEALDAIEKELADELHPRPKLPEGTPRCLGDTPDGRCIRPAGHTGMCLVQ